MENLKIHFWLKTYKTGGELPQPVDPGYGGKALLWASIYCSQGNKLCPSHSLAVTSTSKLSFTLGSQSG